MRAALAIRGLRGRVATLVAAVALLVASAGVAAEFFLFSTAPYQGPGSEGRLAAYMSFFVAALVFLVAVGRVGFVLRGQAPSWAAPLLLLCPVLGVRPLASGGSLFYGIGDHGGRACGGGGCRCPVRYARIRSDVSDPTTGVAA